MSQIVSPTDDCSDLLDLLRADTALREMVQGLVSAAIQFDDLEASELAETIYDEGKNGH